MYDNKIRLSQDVLDKAEQIAAEWGLKNARAAVEAVFRRYSDEYLYGRGKSTAVPVAPAGLMPGSIASLPDADPQLTECEALSELEDLLSM